LAVISPDGVEMRLGAPQIQKVESDLFRAWVRLDPRVMLLLRVINPDGQQSNAFALRPR